MENCSCETILDYPPGVLFCFLVQGQNPNMFYNPAKHHFFQLLLLLLLFAIIYNAFIFNITLPEMKNIIINRKRNEGSMFRNGETLSFSLPGT